MAPLWVTPGSQAVVYVSPLEVSDEILRKSVQSEKTCRSLRSPRRRVVVIVVSRILRLALLAPDIVEAVLGDPLVLENLERPLPASWEAQRDRLGC